MSVHARPPLPVQPVHQSKEKKMNSKCLFLFPLMSLASVRERFAPAASMPGTKKRRRIAATFFFFFFSGRDGRAWTGSEVCCPSTVFPVFYRVKSHYGRVDGLFSLNKVRSESHTKNPHTDTQTHTHIKSLGRLARPSVQTAIPLGKTRQKYVDGLPFPCPSMPVHPVHPPHCRGLIDG